MTEQPRGIVAILTFPGGNVCCSASDFSQEEYAGFGLKASQENRLRDKLAAAAIGCMCSNHIAAVLDIYRSRQILQALVDRQGFRKSVIYIGHDGDGDGA